MSALPETVSIAGQKPQEGKDPAASLLPVPTHLWTETDCNCAQCLEPEGTVPWGLTERGQEVPQEPGAGLRHEGCVAAVTGESTRQTKWFPPTHLLIWSRGGSGGAFCPGRASAICRMPRSPCSRPARMGVLLALWCPIQGSRARCAQRTVHGATGGPSLSLYADVVCLPQKPRSPPARTPVPILTSGCVSFRGCKRPC